MGFFAINNYICGLMARNLHKNTFNSIAYIVGFRCARTTWRRSILPAGPGGGEPPCWPPPCVPVDGGLSFLVAIGAAFGGKEGLRVVLKKK